MGIPEISDEQIRNLAGELLTSLGFGNGERPDEMLELIFSWISFNSPDILTDEGKKALSSYLGRELQFMDLRALYLSAIPILEVIR